MVNRFPIQIGCLVERVLPRDRSKNGLQASRSHKGQVVTTAGFRLPERLCVRPE